MHLKSKVIVVCYFLCLYLEHFPFPIVWKFLEIQMSQQLLKMDDGSTLPDFNNEKTGEQIVFEQKVFRCNESFVRKVNELIKFLKSPIDFHSYPRSATNNRNKYKKHAQ